jgi:3-hydroxyisobutyrate dehydrogenase
MTKKGVAKAMTPVGFIGLGIMGQPMVRNLLKAGFSVVVFNRTRARDESLLACGASRAESPQEVAARSDIVITMVSDTPDVESVLFGERGVWFGLKPGSIVIDMSTISPTATVKFARRLAEKGCEMLDAPVSGGEQGAQAGTLAIMVGGGKRGVFESCLPIFQAMGKTVSFTGPNGNGQKTKLINQVVGALNILAMVEGLRLARAAGLDIEATLQAISGGAASSWMLANLGPKIMNNDFAPGFSITLQHKDLRLACEPATELGGDYPGIKLVYSLFASAVKKGLGNQGNQGLINLWSETPRSS